MSNMGDSVATKDTNLLVKLGKIEIGMIDLNLTHSITKGSKNRMQQRHG